MKLILSTFVAALLTLKASARLRSFKQDDRNLKQVGRSLQTDPIPMTLGACTTFAMMAGSTATCAGACPLINGNLGISPGTAFTGNFVVANGETSVDSQASSACAASGLAAWTSGKSQTGTVMAAEMGGVTFGPGVYTQGSPINIALGNPRVYLDAGGDSTAEFIFVTSTTLTTCANSKIVLMNGAKAENVYWVLGTALTMGANSVLVGNVLAGSAITIGTKGKICGRAIAQTAVTCATDCTVVITDDTDADTDDDCVAGPDRWLEGTAIRDAQDVNPNADIFETTLIAHEVPIEIDGQIVQALAYNGLVPGPMIRVKEGDRVIVHFVNNLDFMSTIHWHGVQGNNAADGTQVTQMAVPGNGGTFTYDFIAANAGNHWYHSHDHTAQTLFSGMYGPLIVISPEEEQLVNDQVLPAKEGTLIFSDTTFDSSGNIATVEGPSVTELQHMNGIEGKTLLVNGKVKPLLKVTAGEPVRLRLINTSISRYFRLSIPGAKMTRIGGEDGLIGTPTLEGGARMGMDMDMPMKMCMSDIDCTSDSGSKYSNCMPMGMMGGVCGAMSMVDLGYESGEIVLAPATRATVVITLPSNPEMLTMRWEDFNRGKHAMEMEGMESMNMTMEEPTGMESMNMPMGESEAMGMESMNMPMGESEAMGMESMSHMPMEEPEPTGMESMSQQMEEPTGMEEPMGMESMNQQMEEPEPTGMESMSQQMEEPEPTGMEEPMGMESMNQQMEEPEPTGMESMNQQMEEPMGAHMAEEEEEHTMNMEMGKSCTDDSDCTNPKYPQCMLMKQGAEPKCGAMVHGHSDRDGQDILRIMVEKANENNVASPPLKMNTVLTTVPNLSDFTATVDWTGLNRINLRGGMDADGTWFDIDGVQWSFGMGADSMPAAPASRREAKLGDLIEFEVHNHSDMNHPFHLHGFSFQPMYFMNMHHGDGWMRRYDHNVVEFLDTVDIPPHTSMFARVRLDNPAGDAKGRWLFHCHIAQHAEGGMISELLVV
jgi:FtsP/CotA-like multicopper oxidase with cupredoxin domain